MPVTTTNPGHAESRSLRQSRGILTCVACCALAWMLGLSPAGNAETLPVHSGAVTHSAAGAPGVPAPSDAFGQAVETWLHGPEDAALAHLSELAQGGDPAARVLLGLIDKSPALQGPWLSRLPRGQRLALMRAPSGLSGQSWLRLAHGHPVADHWLTLMTVDASLETAASLARLGEARAAREAVLILAARERLQVNLSGGPDAPGSAPADAAGWPDWMDPELVYVLWTRADTDLREILLALVPEDHPQRALMGQSVPDGALSTWLQDSHAAAPLRGICDAACPASRAACLLAAYQALGSHNGLLAMGSPAETLIDNDTFLTARRGRIATLRRILLSVDARGRRAQIARARQTDTCLADLLASESDSYRYIREGSATPGTTGPAPESASDRAAGSD